MKYLESFFLIISIVAAILLIAGIFKPWVVLWWKERQNRRKVFRLYGTIALVSFLLHAFLTLI